MRRDPAKDAAGIFTDTGYKERQELNFMEKKSEIINREDMLELTRRMTPARTSFTRIAGCYVDQEGRFGALGHGISDTDTGELLDVSGGELYQAQIISIIRGTQGVPGELSGYIEYEEEKKIGTIEQNTDIGIFGQIFSDSQFSREKVMIGYKQEVKEGKAQILMQIEGKVEYYDIEITEIYSSQQNTNKSFQIQVTDPDLLAKTGGIVQGMSGSPILQNGKLVGAVTHVFVQDSSKGYGIFIENMLG